MQQLNLKPSYKPVKDYYAALGQYGQLNIDHEMAVRSAFGQLLEKCARQFEWTLVPEYALERKNASPLRVDGALLDAFRLRRGLWEAKDERDDLEKEAKHKIASGYPTDNIIFQAPERAILFQNGVRQGLNEDISSPQNLVELLHHFFEYRVPHHEEWEAAVKDFSARLPEIAGAAKELIEKERRTNPAFVSSFDAFYALCQQAINPNLSVEAVENMLIQHLLTERIFRKIFDNPDFTRRNVIAVEIEKVIDSLTSRAFNRDAFLHDLDRFYKAIEVNAQDTSGYTEKQAFLNTVYERFFQGYSPKEADTHGIVYTPQPIVNFMVRSVEEILQKEFGRSLSDRDVHILDPFVGTGNFIVRVMQEIKTSALPYKYENELHCNEVMLLPYYIASMNIEHAYLERTGEYKPFPGICMVDTFELAEPEQSKLGFMTAENAERVERQKKAPIFVIIGNPPYNVGQASESDQNKNRSYRYLDTRIRETYVRDSKATNTRALADHYVRAIRWASDRIGTEGVVCLVTNNNYLDALAADGMRAGLAGDFTDIYIVDLGGNVRRNPKLSGTTHNVFGIQIGVSIAILIRKHTRRASKARLFYVAMDEWWRKEHKYAALDDWRSPSEIPWRDSVAARSSWRDIAQVSSFDQLIAITSTNPHRTNADEGQIFKTSSRGVETARDEWVYKFQSDVLTRQVERFIDFYNGQVAGWQRAAARNPKLKVDDFVTYDDSRIKWSSSLKERLVLGITADFQPGGVRSALYRPFVKQFVYYDSVLTHRRGAWYRFLPSAVQESENRTIVATDVGLRSPFSTLSATVLPDFHLCATTDTFRCYPFYTYDEDGSNRRENITDWALEQFRSHYGDPSISKWDIFHYIYAVLHHPQYRQRYAANLKRELPRIPFVGVDGIFLPDTVILSEGAAHRSAPESKDLAVAQSAGEAAGSSAQSRSGETQGPSTRPSSVQSGLAQGDSSSSSGGLARDDRRDAGEGARATNFKSDLEVFRAFVKAGEGLADLHVNYEKQPEYPLQKIEKPGEKLDWRVEKMRLSRDKTSIAYNQFLTLSGIPPETFEYRLGNRSALDWVIDQYQVSTDKRSGIANDPNRADDPQYIVRLIGQVITVSLETMKIVKSLPDLGFPAETQAAAAP